MRILTVDIGGTMVKSAIYHDDGALIMALEDQPSAVSATSNKLIEQIVALVELALKYGELDGVAIASAGIVDSQAGVILLSGNIPGYTGTRLKQKIQQATKLPCSVENDVNAMALGEAWQGAAQGSQSSLCLALGTGLGGAIVVDGALWRGHRFGAGEIGLVPLADSRILEQAVSTTALLADYQRLSGETVDGRELFARLQQGDRDAETALDTLLEVLCDGLLPALYLLSPQALIIGGGIAGQRAIIEPRIRQKLAEKVALPLFLPDTICCATLGNRAAMVGALKWFLQQ